MNKRKLGVAAALLMGATAVNAEVIDITLTGDVDFTEWEFRAPSGFDFDEVIALTGDPFMLSLSVDTDQVPEVRGVTDIENLDTKYYAIDAIDVVLSLGGIDIDLEGISVVQFTETGGSIVGQPDLSTFTTYYQLENYTGQGDFIELGLGEVGFETDTYSLPEFLLNTDFSAASEQGNLDLPLGIEGVPDEVCTFPAACLGMAAFGGARWARRGAQA